MRTDLFVGIEQMVGDDEGLGIDDGAAGGAPAPSAEQHHAWFRCGGRAREIV
jgi:hypothetical protein